MGIEPTALAWEARVLPLYDARMIKLRTIQALNLVSILLQFSCYMTAFSLIINGERRIFDTPLTVSGLVATLGYADKRVAVERNGEIVPRSQHDAVRLESDDKLEIVVAVGGG